MSFGYYKMNPKSIVTSLICLFVSCLLSGQVTITDDFNTQSYSNNSADWATDWIENGNDTNNGPTAQYIGIFNNRLEFNRISNQAIQRTVNLSGASVATLTFDLVVNTLDSGENLLVQITGNGGTTSFTIASTTAVGTKSINIDNRIDSATTIEFISGGGNWESPDDVFIDNVTFTLSAPDTDGDGLDDLSDLDDDNDGILDTVENSCGSTTGFEEDFGAGISENATPFISGTYTFDGLITLMLENIP